MSSPASTLQNVWLPEFFDKSEKVQDNKNERGPGELTARISDS